MTRSFDLHWGKKASSFRPGRWLTAALVLGAAACTGEIGRNPSQGSGSGSGSGSGAGSGSATGTGAGSSGSSSTTGGSSGTGMPPPGATDVGRIAIHRLNNVEYDNTMRALL